LTGGFLFLRSSVEKLLAGVRHLPANSSQSQSAQIDPKQKLDLESPMDASQRERSIIRVLRTLATGRKQPYGIVSSSQHGPYRLASPLNLHGLD
jgi:hypothetical protein